MTKLGNEARCWYCHAPLSRNNTEADHAPLPREAGGTETVPSCRTCHDLKDRIPVDNWPWELISVVWKDLESADLRRETRIFFAKAIRLLSMGVARDVLRAEAAIRADERRIAATALNEARQAIDAAEEALVRLSKDYPVPSNEPT